MYDSSTIKLFADQNIMAIEHADFEGIERLAAVLGAEIVSTFDNPEGMTSYTLGLLITHRMTHYFRM